MDYPCGTLLYEKNITREIDDYLCEVGHKGIITRPEFAYYHLFGATVLLHGFTSEQSAKVIVIADDENTLQFIVEDFKENFGELSRIITD